MCRKKQVCVEVNIMCFKLSPALGDFAALQVSYPVPAQWSMHPGQNAHDIDDN